MSSCEVQPAIRSRRRRLQYSLRILLIVMLLVSVGLSWLAVRIDRAERQREAVEDIKKLGGVVLHDWDCTLSLRRGRPLFLRDPPPPGWLSSLLGDDFRGHAVGVKVCGSHVTDADLEILKKLRHLGVLRLEDTNTTSEGLAAIQRFLPNCDIMALPLSRIDPALLI
jgi:hypothetical protein